MQRIDLETLADRKLRQLRPPHAPRTLLPRVLAAVQQWALRPWYSRAWLTWPAAWQVASVAGLILLIAACAAVLPEARSAVTAAASRLAPAAIGDLRDIARGMAVAMTAAQALWRTLFEPFVKYFFALVVMMGLACAAFGSVLSRIAFERTSHP